MQAKDTGKVSFWIEWNSAGCGHCPRQAQCLGPGQAHRTVVVGELTPGSRNRNTEMRQSIRPVHAGLPVAAPG